MESIKNKYYNPATATRKTRFRENWSTKQMKMLGADVCKLLWFFRPDSSVADHQRDVVKGLVEECTSLSLPLVVEPIWYPLEGEDPTSTAWRARRVQAIIQRARAPYHLLTHIPQAHCPPYPD